ncbi:ABC transporter ATP-binding protein [Paracoccus sp. MBLB3053]|uniref:ABC transporter ATP-binding protein n=1 Tax=Paracoccus aurantius TaxID=3073814 RepID=A0ABU2HX49_9RHOB|nr:ABC transporter ATP-binding protein [Paracoccus sp. MBLB3053]MDS9469593.1 ABC transporter ATP-binding protein [Paracoccus sp. MBLB3053]
MLEIRDLTIRYGRHLAVDGLSLQVAPGETVALLGANGAGKSSTLNAIAGRVRPAAGQISLSGGDLLSLPPHHVVDLGVALVPEGRGVFGPLSVEENLRLGANPLRARAREAATRDEIFSLFPRLAERRRQAVNTMSGGEQQMVAIARALMSAPDYLLLDEPSLGLAPVVTEELFAALAQIKARGLAILLIEQNVRLSLALASRAYLLTSGRMAGAGDSAAIAADPKLTEIFLGRRPDTDMTDRKGVSHAQG